MTIKKYKETISANRLKSLCDLIELERNTVRNSISLSEILFFYRQRYQDLKGKINEYNQLLNANFTKKMKLNIIGFDYQSRDLIVAFNDGASICRLTYNQEKKLNNQQNEKLIIQMKFLLDEIISLYQYYEEYFTKQIICDSLNSNIIIKINYHDLNLILNNGTVICKNINGSNFDYSDDFYNYFSHTKNNNEEALLKNIYINILNCPEWIINEWTNQKKNKIKKRIFSFI